MVVEELVAKLGFKVDGLGEIKKFDNALKHAKGTVSSFGTAMNKWLGNLKIGALNGIGSFGGKLAQGFKSAASSVAIAAAGAARMAAAVGAVSLALAGAVALAAKLAYNFVKARGEAAQLRREAQLIAQGDRTKVGNVEGLQKGLDLIAASGALKDVAKSFVGNLAKEADAEIRGEGGGKYKKAGVNLLDPNGVQRDTAEVAKEIMGKYADMAKAGQIARRELAIENAKIDQGKGSRKAADAAKARANKFEVEGRKFASDFGIDGPLKAALDELRNGAAQFREAMDKALKLNPSRTADQEDGDKDRAKRYEELRQKVEGVGNGLQGAVDGVKDSIADRLHGAIDDTANAILSLGKYLRIIPETKGEVQDRAKAKVDASKDPAGIAAAQKAANDALKSVKGGEAGSFLRWLMGMGDATDKLIEASKDYKAAKSQREANAGQDISKGAAAGIEKSFQDAAAKFLEAFKQLQETQRQNTPDAAAKKANEKAEKKVINDNRSDMGNDHRVNHVTVNQTVSTFAEGAQQAAKAVLGAVSAKASVSMTAASTAV